MQAVDKILYPKWLITMAGEVQALTNHAVVIQQNKIQDVLPSHEAMLQYNAKQSITLADHALLPGFINAHTHSPMSLFRGMADDLPLMDWLHQHIWPAEAKWLSPAFVRVGTELAIAEMISCGTTCFNEFYFFAEDIIATAKKTGLRCVMNSTLFNGSNAYGSSENEFFEKAIDVFAKEQHPLITIGIGPHSPYAVSKDYLIKVRDFAEQHALPVTMHVHETQAEIAICQEKYNRRPIDFLQNIGLLSTHFQAVHCTHLNDDDIKQLLNNHCHIIHCPESNLKLASGLCKVDRLLNTGLNVAIGTDGPVSNNDLDMISEMRTAAMIGKLENLDPTAVNATTVLQMATVNGAKALGLENSIGSIVAGKQADIIAINLKALNTQPIYDPISQIVYAANAKQVSDVWVAGKQLLKNHQLTTIDTTVLFDHVEQWQKEIAQRHAN